MSDEHLEHPVPRIKQAPVAENDEERQELELINQYTSCFQGPAAEFVLADLYGLCYVDNSVFVAGEFDPIKAAFYEGMRYVVLRLFGYSGRRPFQP